MVAKVVFQGSETAMKELSALKKMWIYSEQRQQASTQSNREKFWCY
jgi:hypothetical protein